MIRIFTNWPIWILVNFMTGWWKLILFSVKNSSRLQEKY
ncbi:hypothetical protein EVA_09626 [gut metagenome]|uniref:Uncharacterized protein n=1 Tax=gut metagenome TaxID=749906 RepID=J9GJQ0_9ZZZZ